MEVQLLWILQEPQVFEPYLLIYLLGMGLDLFQVGLLFAVREAVVYIFEVPSGIIADHYGKKKELLACFLFYIIAFVFFFIGSNAVIIGSGMVFYALGEAFRSGTHKAMILSYLERKGWFGQKAFVYGRTRSFSLLGSSLSAFLSIVFVLNLPALRWIFLVCIIPYLVDFMLILSYPDDLDERKETEVSISEFYRLSVRHLKEIGKDRDLRKIVFSSAVYEGVFRTVKDYIQPILGTIILASGIGLIAGLDNDRRLKVYLGLIYGAFYILSSVVSKNIYRLTDRWNAKIVYERLFDVMGLLMLLLSLAIGNEMLAVVIGVYFALYLMKDARKPVFVDVSGDYMDKGQRATVLSIGDQMRALLMIFFAPIFGWIATHVSLSALFLVIGVGLLFVNRMLILKRREE